MAGLPADSGPFVLNLCSSTTPMALAKCEQPELKRFSFFVSRRFEEGRERFRLHMGFFATLEEAEEWLGAVRDIYPGAWAGEAPGKKLRERAALAALAAAAQANQSLAAPDMNVPTLQPPTLQPAVAQPPTGRPVAPRPAARPAVQPPTAKPAAQPPALRSALTQPAAVKPPVQSPVVASGVAPAALAPRKSAPATPASATGAGASAAPAAGQARKPTSAALVRPPASPARAPQSAAGPLPIAVAPARTAAAAPARAAAPAAAASAPARAPNASKPAVQVKSPQVPLGKPATPMRAAAKSALPNSNVREVLAALDDPHDAATGETQTMPGPRVAGHEPGNDTFSDTQVLRLLETRRPDGAQGADAAAGAISLLKPDDTGTRRALKKAVLDNAPVWFAVQLQWSVQPVELLKVPPLAIFSAYTLYTVEGSRDGRKWYGLRLGFFSDAISAKQVAYYVRSEFTSVAVVPVSPQERARASEVDKKAAGVAFAKKARSATPVDEFKLIDADAPTSVPVMAPPPANGIGAASPSTALRRGGRVRARDKRAPQTLEETLEILGASQLEIDDGRGESLNDSGVRHVRVEVQKNTPFSRLLERLSERMRKT